MPSVGPKSDTTPFNVSRHLKGHCPAHGPSDTISLLIDTLPTVVPRYSSHFAQQGLCIFYPSEAGLIRGRVASGPQPAMRSPFPLALLIAQMHVSPWPPVPYPSLDQWTGQASVKETISVVDRLTGCVEVALRKMKCQTSCILKSKSMSCQTPCATSAIYMFLLFCHQHLNTWYGLHIHCGEGKKKSYLSNTIIAMVEFRIGGARYSGYEQMKLQR